MITTKTCQQFLTIFAVMGFLSGCASTPQFQVAKDSIALTGTGQSVSMRGRAVELSGASLKVGDKLPAAMLVNTSMATVDVGTNPGTVRVISFLPSLDTATCDAQTTELGGVVGALDPRVEVFTVSMDLPFAQRRYAGLAKLPTVTFLSDYRSAAFGSGTGVLQQASRLLARGVMVVDQQNVIRYFQVVPDQSQLPNMKEAARVATQLL
jgi:thioredoxin-dependent peroxiredoxin